MALMFRSVLQNDGGAAELIVTCDSEFAGATISCSDGTTTLNKTCPSSSPYEVTFKIPNSGDWTISATVSGTAYTSDPISVELDYTALLEYGFNWRRWVDTARFLDSTDYNSLDEVLADEEAVRELCLEHACVDYLARVASATADIETIINNDLFAKWINNSDYSLDVLGANVAIKALMDEADKYGYGEWVITDDTTTPPTWGPKGNVPVMTSNTTPYGTAVSNGPQGSTVGVNAYKAFDGDDSTFDAGATGAQYQVGYYFKNPICLKRFGFLTYDRCNAFDLLARNSESDDWEVIYTGNAQNTSEKQYVNLDNSEYYMQFLFRINSTHQYNPTVWSLQFYGRELSVSVPTMVTNTTPYGEASASSVYTASYPAWKAFDNVSGSNADAWTSNTSTSLAWLQYKFENPVTAKIMMIEPSYGSAGSIYHNAVKSFRVIASNDNFVNDSHEILASTSLSDTDVGTIFYMLDNDEAYQYYRVADIDTYFPDNTKTIRRLQFYGLDYSEKEFEAGTTKKWLYDHGVELEALNTSGTVNKEDSYAQIIGVSSEAGKYGVDTTNYTLIRARCGLHASGTNRLYCGTENYSEFNANNMPNNNGFDTSNINGSNSTKVRQYAAGTFDLTELWLE